ncbi:hypothetical protein [Kitasatospora cheerisanensis]|uniref:hypothetical protein n=1 Tax=Kitasatospora cheerisanensis TaxID=81942 RepID=UPI0012ED6C0C|nr:hypothetical protein [Kitasatospora cheerisanensis]
MPAGVSSLLTATPIAVPRTPSAITAAPAASAVFRAPAGARLRSRAGTWAIARMVRRPRTGSLLPGPAVSAAVSSSRIRSSIRRPACPPRWSPAAARSASAASSSPMARCGLPVHSA